MNIKPNNRVFVYVLICTRVIMNVHTNAWFDEQHNLSQYIRALHILYTNDKVKRKIMMYICNTLDLVKLTFINGLLM